MVRPDKIAFAFTINLVPAPEVLAEYEELHRNTWPEVIESARRLGIETLRIFRHGYTLFMYLEARFGFDPDTDLSRLSETSRVREWGELTARLQVPSPGARPGDWWSQMDLIHDHDWFPSR